MNPNPRGPLRKIILKENREFYALANVSEKESYGGFKLLMSGPSLDGLTSRLLAVLLLFPLAPLLLKDFENDESKSMCVSLPICLSGFKSPKFVSSFNFARRMFSDVALSAAV